MTPTNQRILEELFRRRNEHDLEMLRAEHQELTARRDRFKADDWLSIAETSQRIEESGRRKDHHRALRDVVQRQIERVEDRDPQAISLQYGLFLEDIIGRPALVGAKGLEVAA